MLCRNCGSNNLYWDREVQDYVLSCRMCGERYYQDIPLLDIRGEEKSKAMENTDTIACPSMEGRKISEFLCKKGGVMEIPVSTEAEGRIVEKSKERWKPYKSIGTCPVCGGVEKKLYAYHGHDICGTCKYKKNREKKKGEVMLDKQKVNATCVVAEDTDMTLENIIRQREPEIAAMLACRMVKNRRSRMADEILAILDAQVEADREEA